MFFRDSDFSFNFLLTKGEVMAYRITGKVCEQETGKPLSGLKVRAYDADLFFDDLLGTAETDAEGQFEMEYLEEDFRELFEGKPDVYLAIFSSTFRPIFDTKESTRWGANETEHFEIAIPRKNLQDDTPELSNEYIDARILVTERHLEIREVHGFSAPTLPGFSAGGTPGEVALPTQNQYLALPRGGEVTGLEIDPGQPVRLKAPNPLPVQEPYPDLGTNPEDFSDGFTHEDFEPEFTPLAEQAQKRADRFPTQLAELEGYAEFGHIRLASVRVTPVQYDAASQSYLFYPKLKYRAIVKQPPVEDSEKEDRDDGREIGYAEAELVNQVLDMDVTFRTKDLLLPRRIVWEEAPHVIITDNHEWPEKIDNSDGTTRPPSISERGPALTGDLVAEFDRLAAWKTAKGTRSKVVTVSQIVDGQFGDLTQGGFARDLPEVIRNFVKFARTNWKSSFFLMAGDINVVPIRKLCGCSTYKTIGVWKQATNPPPAGSCHLVAGKSTAKLYPRFTPGPDDPLATRNGGLRIPFDRQAGSGRLGWYYTNEDDFTTKDDGFERLPAGDTSRFIIVEGPEAVIDDSFYWYRDVNSIPSDFYYASIEGPGYSQPGNHDFDLDNNGLYGQYHSSNGSEVSLDGVDFAPDVYVGRASVETGEQARGFVDKIIAYEKLEDDLGTAIDTDYLKKIVYAAAIWGKWKRHYRQTDTSIPPEEGRFTHVGGATETKLHLDFDVTLSGGTPSRQIVAREGGNDTLILYNTSAGATNLGWYFCTDNTYGTQSATATRFVRIRGPETSIDPDHFDWDVTGLESSVVEKEDLRGRMDSWFSQFDQVQRHYDDYFDLSPPPPLQKLVSADIKSAIDGGCHFLSLTGHGNSGGCCGININTQDFANDKKFFVAFADSCSTAKIDANDSAGEVLTIDPDGGGVAYVGNTRYSWIGIGDNFERFFWNKLAVCGRPGVAAGLRASSGGSRWVWVIYAQNFFGDPEMPVYTQMPRTLQVNHPRSVNWGGSFTVNVRSGSTNLRGAKVTILAGWRGGTTAPDLLESKHTNAKGNAGFRLPARGKKPPERLRITVVQTNYKPYTIEIPIR